MIMPKHRQLEQVLSPLQQFNSLVLSLLFVGTCRSCGDDVRGALFQAMRLTVGIAVLIILLSFLMSGVYFSKPKKA